MYSTSCSPTILSITRRNQIAALTRKASATSTRCCAPPSRIFRAKIHWQRADGDTVTTFKTYYGTHKGPFLGIAATGREIHFESVDVVMRVQNGKITDHWGVGNLLSAVIQLGALSYVPLLELRT